MINWRSIFEINSEKNRQKTAERSRDKKKLQDTAAEVKEARDNIVDQVNKIREDIKKNG